MTEDRFKYRVWNKKTNCFFFFDTTIAFKGESSEIWGDKQQCTGLKDKDGNLIYEGDILNSKNDGSDGHDIWDYSTHQNIVVEFMTRFMGYNLSDLMCLTNVHHVSRIEIIGNISENPELLSNYG